MPEHYKSDEKLTRHYESQPTFIGGMSGIVSVRNCKSKSTTFNTTRTWQKKKRYNVILVPGEVLEKRTIHHFHSFSALHGYRIKTCTPI